jgi:hypothetical protein
MKKILLTLSIILFSGCTEHRVDTFKEWCEQINGVKLQDAHSKSWTVIFSVSYKGDEIRDDFTKFLNESYLQKVQNRSKRMAWREGANLHLIGLSSLMGIEADEEVSMWKEKINLAKEFKSIDKGDTCLFGTVTSMFDSLTIHSMEYDGLGINWKDNVTNIDTERNKFIGKNKL